MKTGTSFSIPPRRYSYRFEKRLMDSSDVAVNERISETGLKNIATGIRCKNSVIRENLNPRCENAFHLELSPCVEI